MGALDADEDPLEPQVQCRSLYCSVYCMVYCFDVLLGVLRVRWWCMWVCGWLTLRLVWETRHSLKGA